jgi:hypothetical protein
MAFGKPGNYLEGHRYQLPLGLQQVSPEEMSRTAMSKENSDGIVRDV